MYSRRLKIEEERNKRRAIFFVLLTLAAVVLMFFYGIPVLVKFAGFVYDLRKSGESVEIADNTPPPPPRFDPLPSFTNNARLEPQGYTESGATVILDFNAETEEVIANNEGRFSFSFELQEGENKLIAFSKDTSGNESQKTETYTIVFDKEPPELEVTKPSNGAEFYGSRQRQLVIEGKTEKDAKVQINNRLVVVDLNGNFTFVTTLNEGENVFNIKSQDPAGNQTEKTLSVKYFP